ILPLGVERAAGGEKLPGQSIGPAAVRQSFLGRLGGEADDEAVGGGHARGAYPVEVERRTADLSTDVRNTLTMLTAELMPGIALRLLEERDADELYELVDRNRAYLAPWMPWAAAESREDVINFIR